MSSFDPERFLTEPIYALDFQVMAGDLQDFLDTSEKNIEQQYHLRCAEIQRRAETGDPPTDIGSTSRKTLSIDSK